MAMNSKAVDIIPPKDIWVGNENANLVMLQFGDYEDEACMRANEIVVQLLEEFGSEIKFIFRHFPLTKIHQRAQKAAEASVAAAQEGKFWEMHNLLFANRKNLGTISLKEYAKEAGVENKKFLNELMDSMYGWTVRNDLLEGLEMGIREVPVFFFNNERYNGKISYENLKKTIQEKLKESKSAKKKRA